MANCLGSSSILTGFDVDARPILYMRPGRENTETSPRQIQHLIYHLERAIDFMPPGQEQVAIIIDVSECPAGGKELPTSLLVSLHALSICRLLHVPTNRPSFLDSSLVFVISPLGLLPCIPTWPAQLTFSCDGSSLNSSIASLIDLLSPKSFFPMLISH